MSGIPQTPVVDWIAPTDSAWLQNSAAPPSLVERICDGFRVAVSRPTPAAPPTAWLASTLQKGGVGFFDPPSAITHITHEQAVSLLKFSINAYASSSSLMQLMLPVGDSALEAAAIESGFQLGADLLLLGRSCSDLEIEPLDPSLHFSPCGEELARVLQVTYEETLDCPILSGKRPISEVVEGYAATGSSGKELWRTLFAGDAAVGCVLVAAHPRIEIAELVYMGLVPAARGKGFGLHLLMQAERMTLAAGYSKMVIGVDAANVPARKQYETAGYAIWDRKRVFLCFGDRDSP